MECALRLSRRQRAGLGQDRRPLEPRRWQLHSGRVFQDHVGNKGGEVAAQTARKIRGGTAVHSATYQPW